MILDLDFNTIITGVVIVVTGSLVVATGRYLWSKKPWIALRLRRSGTKPKAAIARINTQPRRAGGIPPHVFTGRALIDGQIVADGVMVEAQIGGEVRGSAVVVDGKYNIAVKAGNGYEVRFFVDGLPVDEKGEWMMGGASMRDLFIMRT